VKVVEVYDLREGSIIEDIDGVYRRELSFVEITVLVVWGDGMRFSEV
jgi:hypothetical protein